MRSEEEDRINAFVTMKNREGAQNLIEAVEVVTVLSELKTQLLLAGVFLTFGSTVSRMGNPENNLVITLSDVRPL